MATDAGTEAAISRFDGYSLDERNIAVTEARPRQDRPGGGFRRY
jgi:hypothetical protein